MPPPMPMRVDGQLVPYSPLPTPKPCWPTKQYFLGTRTSSSVCLLRNSHTAFTWMKYPQENWYLVTPTEEDSNFNDDSIMYSKSLQLIKYQDCLPKSGTYPDLYTPPLCFSLSWHSPCPISEMADTQVVSTICFISSVVHISHCSRPCCGQSFDPITWEGMESPPDI